MESSKSSAVELYSKLGWSVLPVDSNSKKPLIPWMSFQRRRPTSLDLHQWSNDFPKAGIAVVTGPISNILVLDADGKSGLEEVKSHGFDNTPIASTPGGGLHIYYKWPADMQPFRNSVKLGDSKKLDVRGDAAYVVAPYTKRDDGKKYEWLQHPNKTPLAEVPKWFMKILKTLSKISNMKVNKVDSGTMRAPLRVEELILRCPIRIQKYIREGHDLEVFPSRSECDMAVVVSLLTKGASYEDIQNIFSVFPIGDKYNEPDEKGHYLERTVEMASQRVKEVRIKYADPIQYDESRFTDSSSSNCRLQLAFNDIDGMIRSGLTMPNESMLGNDKWKNCLPRWDNFFNAVNINPYPTNFEQLKIASKKLVGKELRIEIDMKGSRMNPIIGFHRI